MLDELDNRIMRDMITDPVLLTFQVDVRRSYRAIGRKLGTTEDTIARRIKALEQSGYLGGWRVGVNPRVLGYRTTAFDYNPQPLSKSEGYSGYDVVEVLLRGLCWWSSCPQCQRIP